MTLSQSLPNTPNPTVQVRVTPIANKESMMDDPDYPVWPASLDCEIKSQVSLASYASLRTGGLAEWYAAPRSRRDLEGCLSWAKQANLPITLIGMGSNLLISDRGLPGLVLSLRHLRSIQFDAALGQITASAGEPIARLAWQAADRGWQGLVWAVGIPGSVGGAVVMNAGAHGQCIADILVKTTVLDASGELLELAPADLHYQYRSSSLQNTNQIVLQATFQLQPGGNPEEVTAATTADLDQRRATQPYHLPSCGSVFRNPPGHKAAQLIDQLGLKGTQIGGAQVSERHANFIVNCGQATSTDIYQLMCYVQQQVHNHYGIFLEPEVKLLGKFDCDRA